MKITGRVREVGHEAIARRQEMSFAISNALALIGWHDFGSFLGNFAGGGAVWLLGFLLAIVTLATLATEVALVLHTAHRPKSNTRLIVDHSDSMIPESPGQVSSVD
jgi:hypothetical protein